MSGTAQTNSHPMGRPTTLNCQPTQRRERLRCGGCCRWRPALEVTVTDTLQSLGRARSRDPSGRYQGTPDIAADRGGHRTHTPPDRPRTSSRTGRTTAPLRLDGSLATHQRPTPVQIHRPEAAGCIYPSVPRVSLHQRAHKGGRYTERSSCSAPLKTVRCHDQVLSSRQQRATLPGTRGGPSPLKAPSREACWLTASNGFALASAARQEPPLGERIIRV